MYEVSVVCCWELDVTTGVSGIQYLKDVATLPKVYIKIGKKRMY